MKNFKKKAERLIHKDWQHEQKSFKGKERKLNSQEKKSIFKKNKLDKQWTNDRS